MCLIVGYLVVGWLGQVDGDLECKNPRQVCSGLVGLHVKDLASGESVLSLGIV